MLGNAIDIDVRDLSLEQRKELIEALSAAGIGGIGVYKNTLHADIGPKRSWGPSFSSRSLPGWAKESISKHLSGKVAPLTVAAPVPRSRPNMAQVDTFTELRPTPRARPNPMNAFALMDIPDVQTVESTYNPATPRSRPEPTQRDYGLPDRTPQARPDPYANQPTPRARPAGRVNEVFNMFSGAQAPSGRLRDAAAARAGRPSFRDVPDYEGFPGSGRVENLTSSSSSFDAIGDGLSRAVPQIAAREERSAPVSFGSMGPVDRAATGLSIGRSMSSGSNLQPSINPYGPGGADSGFAPQTFSPAQRVDSAFSAFEAPAAAAREPETLGGVNVQQERQRVTDLYDPFGLGIGNFGYDLPGTPQITSTATTTQATPSVPMPGYTAPIPQSRPPAPVSYFRDAPAAKVGGVVGGIAGALAGPLATIPGALIGKEVGARVAQGRANRGGRSRQGADAAVHDTITNALARGATRSQAMAAGREQRHGRQPGLYGTYGWGGGGGAANAVRAYNEYQDLKSAGFFGGGNEGHSMGW